ncbi:MAG: hemolysin III family protein [Cyclobacteriaceae bacterium]
MKTDAIPGFEDPVSSFTHLLGACVISLLLFKLFRKGHIGRKHPIPILLYGVTSIFLLSMSGIYHLLPKDTNARYVLRILDHAGIFLLISGTLIAIHLVLFSGMMKRAFIIVTSTIAILGITFGTIYFNDLPAYMTHAIFVTFGLFGLATIIAIVSLKKGVQFKYLLLGGAAYVTGAFIDWVGAPVLIPVYFGAHELFHIAVLLGLTFHWIFLLRLIDTYYSEDKPSDRQNYEKIIVA